MANTTIAIKKSATAAAIPSVLQFGELAINYADGKLFYKNVNSSIVEFSPSGGGGNSFGTVNANSTLVVADTAGDILTIVPGTNINIVGDAVNDRITVGLQNDLAVTTVTATGNISAANLTTTGQIVSTRTNSAVTGEGQIYLNGSTGNRLDFNDQGTGAPAFTTRSVGTKIVLYPTLGASQADYALGINAGTLWSSIPGNDSGQFFKWYGGTTQVASLSGTGEFTTTGVINGSILSSTQSSGDEGGQFELALAATNNLLVGSVAIDINQSQLRIFETGGTNRGVYINLLNAGTGVGTDLLAGSSGSDTIARASAAAAFDKANSANVLAFNTGIGANAYASFVGVSANAFSSDAIATASAAVGAGANTVGSAAFTKANIAETIAIAAFDNSNTKFSSNGGTITGEVAITGNLTITGNVFSQDTETLRVSDPLIYLAANNYVSDIVDIGFIGNYVNATGSNVHTGLYREHTDKEYYLFQGYDQEVIDNHIGAFSNNMTLAVLNADLKTSNLTLGGQNTINWITSAFTKANSTSYSSNVVISVADNTNAALRITQTGTAYALLVEDSTNPDATPFVIDANGFVGIANTSPGHRLSVEGSSYISGTLGLGTTSNPSASKLYMATTSNPRMLTIQSTDVDSSAGVGLTNDAREWAISVRADLADSLAIRNITTNEDMFIVANTGNVGIGTTTPTQKLDVNGTVNASKLNVVGDVNIGSILNTGTGVSTGVASIELGGSRTGSGIALIDFHAETGTDNEARIIRGAGVNGNFLIQNSGTGQFAVRAIGAGIVTLDTNNLERVRVAANGNVAIGSTSTDIAKLFVDGTIIGSQSFTSRVPGGLANTARGFRQVIDGTEYLAIHHDNSNMIVEVNGVQRMRIDAAGNVGIGTTSTSLYKLDVNGTINAASVLVNGSPINSASTGKAIAMAIIFG